VLLKRAQSHSPAHVSSPICWIQPRATTEEEKNGRGRFGSGVEIALKQYYEFFDRLLAV